MRRTFWHEALLALLFALVVLVVLALAGCKDGHALPAPAGPAVRGQSVIFPAAGGAAQRFAVEKVLAASERELELPGRLVWNEDRTVRVFPPFAGRVTRIFASPGDRVAAGTPLVEMVSPDFGQAQADAEKAQADRDLAERTLARVRTLVDHGVAAAKDLQQAEADDARARAEARRALDRIAAYRQPVGSGSRFVLKSPMAGTVVERNLNPGQELRPDQPGAPLFVVTDPASLWVALDAHEADLRYLHAGVALAISSSQLPGETFTGTLRQVSDFVDPVARTVKLRGDVPNARRALKAEMFVTARVRLPSSREPSVSARAVYLSGARRYVFVRTAPATFERREVKVGPESDGRMPVYSGLAPGDEVAVSGNLFLDQMLAGARP
jgi:cobalt-zinc-cadmium efflux system membrane fusion protein